MESIARWYRRYVGIRASSGHAHVSVLPIPSSNCLDHWFGVNRDTGESKEHQFLGGDKLDLRAPSLTLAKPTHSRVCSPHRPGSLLTLPARAKIAQALLEMFSSTPRQACARRHEGLAHFSILGGLYLSSSSVEVVSLPTNSNATVAYTHLKSAKGMFALA